MTTKDGRKITERDVLWPGLPLDTRISELVYLPQRGQGAGIRDCEAYGFQRFRIDTPTGEVGRGAQLIGVRGDDVIVLEFDEVNGVKRKRTMAKSQLTYAPGLLRHGRG